MPIGKGGGRGGEATGGGGTPSGAVGTPAGVLVPDTPRGNGKTKTRKAQQPNRDGESPTPRAHRRLHKVSKKLPLGKASKGGNIF